MSLDFKFLVSKTLGYAILIGAFGLKIPQILNIIKNKSTAGLSPMGFYMEVPLVSTVLVYNYLNNNPISSYGENIVILIQNLVLVVLLWNYSKPNTDIFTIILVLSIFVSVPIICFSLPKELLVFLFIY
jgi:mannose-P-dolichol utilization defect protein 1